MTHLAYELFSDVNAAHPYLTVYLLEDGEVYDPSRFNPFMEIAVEADGRLVLTVYETDRPRSLSIEQWDEISRRAREYQEKILASGEDW